MLTVEDYGRIRCAHRDGMSIREIARRYHHSRRKVRDALQDAVPKGYTRNRPPRAPKLGPFKGVIDEVLRLDEAAPPKQTHTAAQIHRRLVKEHGYQGSYDQVRRYVKSCRQRKRETFIPLHPQPGQRQEVDFGHVYIDFPDGRRKVPVLALTWGYSNRPFMMAMPTERVEAILSGMVAGFEFFGCVPREVWWDNPKTVATAILKGRDRKIHPRYAALASHYVFEPLFCMPRRGWEKPRVENRVYDLQRRFCTPVPRVKDLAELNAYLRQCCIEECKRTVRGQTETIAQRFSREREAALALPVHRFDPCIQTTARADKYQTIGFDSNRYSIPRSHAFEIVTIKGYVDKVAIVAGDKQIACHERSYSKQEQILDPLHYLATLTHRPAALKHSDVYRNWHLPPIFEQLREHLEDRYGARAGTRHYIRVLQLLPQYPKEDVGEAITSCLLRGITSAPTIINEVQRRGNQLQESQLDLFSGTVIPPVHVPRPNLCQYDQLLEKGEPHHGQSQPYGFAS
jgi:transposase